MEIGLFYHLPWRKEYDIVGFLDYKRRKPESGLNLFPDGNMDSR